MQHALLGLSIDEIGRTQPVFFFNFSRVFPSAAFSYRALNVCKHSPVFLPGAFSYRALHLLKNTHAFMDVSEVL